MLRTAPWLACAATALLALAARGTETVGAPPSPAVSEDGEVLRATLDNGLRVIIVRNALAPVVSTSVNYLVGSDEAPEGFPGMAHAQEHMMFRGNPGLTGDQLADIGSIMGGNFNADTRESLTQYLYTVPAEDLDVALHIEAIRMQGVSDTAEGWAQERGAIEQEVAQDLSNPDYVLYEKLRALAFMGTPYEHDALGTRPSFQRTSAQMLQHFYETWYAPNNAILIVVGDVDPSATLGKVRELFGSIAGKSLPPRPVVRVEPLKSANFTVPTDRPNGSVMLAFRVPGLDSADFPALEVLSDVLSNRRFALYDLVPSGKAIDASFSLDPLPQAGLAYATVAFTAGTNVPALERELRAILTRIAARGVPADLVAAAKLQERREFEFQKNSIAGLASVWADAVALYGLRSPGEDLTRIEKVTVEDVNRVARRYLKLDQTITAVLLPQGSGQPVPSSAGGFGGQESIALGPARPTDLPEWAQAAIARLEVPPSTIHPIVSHLPNGLTLIVQPEDVSDTVSIFGRIRNRPEVEEPPGKEGVAQLLEGLLPYGTEQLDRVAFQRALDDIGADAHAGTEFEGRALSEDFDRVTQLLADNALHPALPRAAMQVVQPQLAHMIESRDKSPGYLTQRSLRAALYPPDDPSQREATPASVRALTLEDVRAYHQKVYRPDLTTIVVMGKVTPELAQATIAKYFGSWSATGPPPPTDVPVAPPNRPVTISVPDAARVQVVAVLAQNLALTRKDPDYYALSLGNAVLGGAFYSTRLSIELREKAGLVYGVGSQLEARRTRGVYLVEFASDPGNVSKASAIVVKELRGMQQAPASDGELSRVKALLLRQIPLGEASVDQIGGGFLERTELDLPLDEPTIAAQHYIELDAAAVQVAFQKWIRPGDLVRVTEGPNPQ